MKNTRELFEEIWPVPEGVVWRDDEECYWPHPWNDETFILSDEWDKRLNTFTRCQETAAPVNEIILHSTNLLNYVRDKYGVIGDDFSCEHMRGIAAAIKEIQK